ncbi:hypothetical protein D3C74_91860 [compost metagenome]
MERKIYEALNNSKIGGTVEVTYGKELDSVYIEREGTLFHMREESVRNPIHSTGTIKQMLNDIKKLPDISDVRELNLSIEKERLDGLKLERPIRDGREIQHDIDKTWDKVRLLDRKIAYLKDNNAEHPLYARYQNEKSEMMERVSEHVTEMNQHIAKSPAVDRNIDR